MNWFEGNIAEAVALSKMKNAIFVVFIEGKDELTLNLSRIINEHKIKTMLESDYFVAIKITSGSQAYMQFAKIYQVVPVPSIFFIGSSGTPLDIGTGIIANSDELERKIENVLAQSGRSTASNISICPDASSFISSDQIECLIAAARARKEVELAIAKEAAQAAADEAALAASNEAREELEMDVEMKEDEELCKDGHCQTSAKANETVSPRVELAEGQEASNIEYINACLEETRKQLQKKRRERLEMENRVEREEELRRKRDGREMQELQAWQKDQHLKELKDNIRRERLEEQAARERIRAQIAGDRAERAQKFNLDMVNTGEGAASGSGTRQRRIASDHTRLQFRLSTGNNTTQTFNCQDTLSVVRAFVESAIIPGTGIREFILATTYPKREFTAEHSTLSLEVLGLFPSAVILVIAKEGRVTPAGIIMRSGGFVNMLSILFWTMLTPVFAVLGYLKNIAGRGVAKSGAHKRPNEDQPAQVDVAKRRNLDRFMTGPSTSQQPPAASPQTFGEPESQAHRRYASGSNIHRLSDNRSDSDDENATWNGNSTQQQ